MAGYDREEQEERRGFPLPGVERRAVVTWVLLATNAIVWLAMERAGGSEDPDVLVDFGALFGPLIADGEYWRLLTAIFLHVGLIHLLFNSFGLLIVGQLVERLYGHFAFAMIYVASGLSGSVASFLLNSISIGAGASGAIFGLLAALAAFFASRRDVLGEMGRQNLTGILILALMNLVFGLVTPRVDNWAHMGGFVAGFAIGLAFVPRYRMATDMLGLSHQLIATNSLSQKWWILPVVAAILLGGTLLGTSSLPDNPFSHIYSAERHIDALSYEEARDEISEARRLDPTNPAAHYLQGRIFAELGDNARARFHLMTAIALARATRDRDTESKAEALLRSLEPRL